MNIYPNKLEASDKMDKFLEKHNFRSGYKTK